MHQIRIVLAHMPGMLRGILRETLSGERDFELVVELPEHGGLAGLVSRLQPDVVLFGVTDREGIDSALPLFQAHPGVRLVAMAEDGRRAVLYELRPHAVPIGEVSPDGLIDAIRLAVGQPVEER